MILILGASGKIGGYLFDRFKKDAFEVAGTYRGNKKSGLAAFDLERMDIEDLRLERKPSHVVIAAAVNASPELARDLSASYNVNVINSRRLIDSCLRQGIVPIYISTDNIFDGEKGNYVETDQTNPINNYGRIKCDVENHLFASGGPYVLLRMGKVFGINDLLIRETYNNLRQNKDVRYAVDQVFTPSYAGDVYEFIRDVVLKNHFGVFHLGSISRTTRYEVALRVKEFFKLTDAEVKSCRINELGLAEPRPIKVDLNLSKYKAITKKEEKEIEFYIEKILSVEAGVYE